MTAAAKQRLDWVDYAKGICIVLVVMMHSTLGVEKAAGAVSGLHGFIDWAKPFRMPDFFLISGLFLASRIDRPWRAYLDTKFFHFVYFYILWMTIQFALKGPGIYTEDGLSGVIRQYAMGFIEPFGTLWFIYMLAIFFVVTKATQKIPPFFIFLIGAVLEILTKTGTIETGFLLIDEFASRFVYFFAGFWLAKDIFGIADDFSRFKPFQIFAGLLVWGVVNYLFVKTGLASAPGVSLCLGFVGALAVVASGVLVSKFKFAEALRYCGENSIVIYLSFFLFMAGTRSALFRLAPGLDLSLIAASATAAGVIGPILLFWATRGTALSFLFTRPQWTKLAAKRQDWHSAGHGKLEAQKG